MTSGHVITGYVQTATYQLFGEILTTPLYSAGLISYKTVT